MEIRMPLINPETNIQTNMSQSFVVNNTHTYKDTYATRLMIIRTRLPYLSAILEVIISERTQPRKKVLPSAPIYE